MPPALTPTLAVDYVRELSADVRATVVLDAAGRLLAGSRQLAEPARALLAAGGEAAELEAASGAGVVCAVRSSRHAAIAVCGRFAIPGVVRQDLRAAVAALDGRAPGTGGHDRALPPRAPAPAADRPAPAAHRPAPAADPLARAAAALISASQHALEA
jgi:hypothetical protein